MDHRTMRSQRETGFRDGRGDAPDAERRAAVPSAAPLLRPWTQAALARRTFLKGAAAMSASLVITPAGLMAARSAGAEEGGGELTFKTVSPGDGSEPDVRVPEGYAFDVILRWGDPLTAQAPAFDLANQTAVAQAQQFGFNADLVLWNPLPDFVAAAVEGGGLDQATSNTLGAQHAELGAGFSRRALVTVNHEYTSPEDMFPDFDEATYPSRNQTEVEIEAHGFSVVELMIDDNGRWHFQRDSAFNRRSTGTTPMAITGPLSGDPFMQSAGDPTGTEVLGSFNNCAGGKTPWGTVLTCEENFDQYFGNFDSAPDKVKALSARIPAEGGATERKWETHVARFDLAKDPQEYHRFGYIVEVDPYDPSAKPRKHTALGRFKHEGAAVKICNDGRAAVYSGDDARFEYVYKFISDGRYQPDDRAANMGLLESGTLYVARFDVGPAEGDEKGVGVWLPLTWQEGGALAEAGFASQAEVLLNARGAADVLGATPMDRPEDVEVSPQSGHVFIALTNNSKREEPNEANPRIKNQHGHVIELIEDGDDAGALTFRWNIFIKCGDPSVAAHETRFADLPDPVAAGCSPISDPDNLVHDDRGHLWIATDGQPGSGDYGFGQNDGIFAVAVEGKDRGVLRQFLSGVPGGEVCGPEFSGDNKTFFCAIQHPNDGEAFAKHWPMDETVVSKPSLISVRHSGGKKIGA